MCIPGLNDDDIDSIEEKMPVSKKKEKRRNTEKRKERSRDAARSRRCKEAEHFSDLAASLPYPEHLVAHLDKASIMRLSITYLKLKSFIDAALSKGSSSIESASPWSPLLPTTELFEEAVFSNGALDHCSALGGLLFVVSKDGEIIYASGNVGDQLGLQQVDLLGGSMFDYVHPCDHDELRATLSFSTEAVNGAKSPDTSESVPEEEPDRDEQKIFSLRIKCSGSCNKNRNGTSKPSNHKVFHCTGRLVKKSPPNMPVIEVPESSSEIDDPLEYDSDASCDDFKPRLSGSSGSASPKDMKKTAKPHLVFIAESLERVGASDFLYQKGSFHSKHSLSMKFTDVCDSVTTILGYSKNDLMGKSLFHFHHVLDAVHLEKTFKTLFQKGHCRTNHYRILGKTGGFAWAVTEATVVYGRKSQKPESVSCHNIIISELEHPEEVISAHQLEWSGGGNIGDTDTVVEEDKIDDMTTPVPAVPAPRKINDFGGTEPKIEPPDSVVDPETDPKRLGKGLPDVDVDVDSGGSCFRPKLVGHRLNVAQMLDENFRKEIVGFHPLTKTPCHPVIVQHRRLGSLLVFVSPKEFAEALLAFSAVNRKNWLEDTSSMDDLLDAPCSQDDGALWDVLDDMGTAPCSSPDCSPISLGPTRLVGSERTMKDASDTSLLCGRMDASPPSLELDLDSCLYSPTPLLSEDETLSPDDQGSSPSSLFWGMKKGGQWSDSISSSDSPLENEVLDLHVIRPDECDPLMDEAFPLMREGDATWCSVGTDGTNPLGTGHVMSGKKVQNWLLKEKPLTSPAEVMGPNPLDDIDVTIDPQPPPVQPAPPLLLAPIPSKGKSPSAKSPGKPRTKSPRASTGSKLKNGMKKPFSRNLILGQTYPYAEDGGDWRERAHKAAELRGTAGLFGAEARRLNATVRIEKPREPVIPRAVPLLVQPEMRATCQPVQQVINGQVAQILKLVTAKQPVSVVPATELRLSSPVYVRAVTPKAEKRSGEAVQSLDMTKVKRPCLPAKHLLSTGLQTSSSSHVAAGVTVSPATPSPLPASGPSALLSPKPSNLKCPSALLKTMGVVESGEPHGAPKFHSFFRSGREVDISRLGKSFSTSLLQTEMQAIPTLLELTTQDCDVNAPLPQTTGLLQGADLLRALDMNNYAL